MAILRSYRSTRDEGTAMGKSNQVGDLGPGL